MSFSGSDVWSFLLIIGVLLVSMLIASSLKRAFRVLEKSLIPVSVLGGIILLIISTIVYFATGTYLFDLQIFSSAEAPVWKLAQTASVSYSIPQRRPQKIFPSAFPRTRYLFFAFSDTEPAR